MNQVGIDISNEVFAGIGGTLDDCVDAYNAAFVDFYADELDNRPVTITTASCNRIRGDVILLRTWEADENSNTNSFIATADKPGFCVGADDDGVAAAFDIEISRKDLAQYRRILLGPGCNLVMPMSKLAFRTSTRSDGDLIGKAAGMGLGDFSGNGLGAADAICNKLAGDAGLLGSYTAWLSDSGTDAIDRVTHGEVPYLLVDGSLVADDFDDIINCGNPNCLQTSIMVTETGNETGSPTATWTGTASDGTKIINENCVDWSSASDGKTGRYGVADSTGPGWTSSQTTLCPFRVRLYCFQD